MACVKGLGSRGVAAMVAAAGGRNIDYRFHKFKDEFDQLSEEEQEQFRAGRKQRAVSLCNKVQTFQLTRSDAPTETMERELRALFNIEDRKLFALDRLAATPVTQPVPRTDRTSEGNSHGTTPDRHYYRLPAITQEIDALPSVGDPHYMSALGATIYPETMVHGLRALSGVGRTADAAVAETWMVDRMLPVLAKVRRSWVVEEADREDLDQSTLIRVLRECRDSSPTHQFYEYNFAFALRLAGTGEAKRPRRDRDRVRSFRVYENGAGEEWNEQEILSDAGGEEEFNLVDQNDLLMMLPLKVRLAAKLHIAGYQIGGRGGDGKTIAEILGCSDRMVRFYLAKAKTMLEEQEGMTLT